MAKALNNATAVYVIMLAVFAAGIWGILSFGSTLEAQPDLAGEWEFVAPSAGEKPLSASVEQSGRFLRLKFRDPKERSFDLRIKPTRATPDASRALGQPIVMTSATGGEVTFARTPEPEVYSVTLPDGRTLMGRLMTRTYPKPQSASKTPAITTAAAPASPASQATAPSTHAS